MLKTTILLVIIYLSTTKPYLLDEYSDLLKNDFVESVQTNIRRYVRPNNQFILCGGKNGEIVCEEKVEIFEKEMTDLFPNAVNVTCLACYRRDGSGKVESKTQQKEVRVFKPLGDQFYRHVDNVAINNGCKCSPIRRTLYRNSDKDY